MNYDRHYLDESDADDEYGATHMTSPTLQGEYSPSESEATEHTPTSYARPKSYDAEGTIMRWSAEECAEFVSTLGLEQYADSFIGRTFHTFTIQVRALTQVQTKRSMARHL